MKGYHIAVVGATGAAGTELLRVLERRNFPVASLRLIGSKRSAGKSVRFREEPISVQELDDRSFDKIDIAFFSAGGDVSRSYVPMACQSDAIAIDKSSAFRMDPHVPLVIPEINAEDVRQNRGVIANPNCTTTVMLMALYPLHRVFGVRRVCAVEQAREVLAKAPGLELVDEPQSNRYPMPLSVAGKDNCQVGRVRLDCAFENGLSFWVSGDQLLKGAALNAVQIAELL